MTHPILVDGNNVMFWHGGQAHFRSLELVVNALLQRRFAPVVYFDHSIYRHVLETRLEEFRAGVQAHVAARGTQADALLLDACIQGRIQIVSNDRFRGWRDHHPKLRNGWLVTGVVEKGGRVSFSKKLKPAPL